MLPCCQLVPSKESVTCCQQHTRAELPQFQKYLPEPGALPRLKRSLSCGKDAFQVIGNHKGSLPLGNPLDSCQGRHAIAWVVVSIVDTKKSAEDTEQHAGISTLLKRDETGSLV